MQIILQIFHIWVEKNHIWKTIMVNLFISFSILNLTLQRKVIFKINSWKLKRIFCKRIIKCAKKHLITVEKGLMTFRAGKPHQISSILPQFWNVHTLGKRPFPFLSIPSLSKYKKNPSLFEWWNCEPLSFAKRVEWRKHENFNEEIRWNKF